MEPSTVLLLAYLAIILPYLCYTGWAIKTGKVKRLSGVVIAAAVIIFVSAILLPLYHDWSSLEAAKRSIRRWNREHPNERPRHYE